MWNSLWIGEQVKARKVQLTPLYAAGLSKGALSHPLLKCVFIEGFSIVAQKEMWQHDLIVGCVFLLPSSYTVLTWVSNWPVKCFLKQDFLVSSRWTLKCVKLLKLDENMPAWEINRAGSGVKQLELLKLSIWCSSWTRYSHQGQINQSLHSPSSLVRRATPIPPSASTLILWGTGDAPGLFLQESGCRLSASQAAGTRPPTKALPPGRARFQEVLASRPELRRTISCPEHRFVCLPAKNITCPLLQRRPIGCSLHLRKA